MLPASTVLALAVGLGISPLSAALPLEVPERFEIAGRGTLTIAGLVARPGSFEMILVVQPDGAVTIPHLRATIRDFDVVRRRVFRDRRTPFRCSEAVNVGPLEGHLAPSGELTFPAPQNVYALSYSSRNDRHGCPGQESIYSLTAASNAPAVGVHFPWDDFFALHGTFVTDYDGDTYTVRLDLEGTYANRPPQARMGFAGEGFLTPSAQYTCPPSISMTYHFGATTLSCNFVQANDPEGLRATLVSASRDPDGTWDRADLGLEQWSSFSWSFEDGTETHTHLGRGRTVGPALFDMAHRHTVQLTTSDRAGALDRATCEFCVADWLPPVLTVPPPATVPCSVEGGATPGSSTPLQEFLSSAVAVDLADDDPQALPPRVDGAEVENHTLFPLDEWTEVEFRFQDFSENVAVGHSEVRVIDDVPPTLIVDFGVPYLRPEGRFVKVRPQIRATDDCGLPRFYLDRIRSDGPEAPTGLSRGVILGRPVKEFELLATPVDEGKEPRDRTYVVTYVAVDGAGNETRVDRKLVVRARPEGPGRKP